MHALHPQHTTTHRPKPKSKSRYTTFLDKLTLVVGIIGPLTILPQIHLIFTSKSAEGVSFTTWLLIFLMTLPWILYGIAHKNRTIIACFALWGIMDLLVVIGIFLYG